MAAAATARASAWACSSRRARPRAKTLAEHFRGAKFVFPAAPARPATVLKGAPMSQWFDGWSLVDPEERRGLQRAGVAETSAYVGGLVEEEEARGLGGAERMVLGGLSQGCAVGLLVLLGSREVEEGPLGGFVGMSGWLPFAGLVDSRGEGDGDGGGGNDAREERGCGERNMEGTRLEGIQRQAANTARDMASLPMLSGEAGDEPVFPTTPVLLGHGKHDEKVSVNLGAKVREVLEALGCQVEWKEYEGHWYKVPEQIDDIVRFLSTQVGLGNSHKL